MISLATAVTQVPEFTIRTVDRSSATARKATDLIFLNDGEDGGGRTPRSNGDIDVAPCSSFVLLAQRGCGSRFHRDIMNSAYVASLDGLEFWLALTFTDRLLQVFSDAGFSLPRKS